MNTGQEPAPRTLVELFAGFSRRGDAVAFTHRTGVRRKVMSYARLDRAARQMSKLLAERGVSPGQRVAIWAPNSPWWGVAFWGIMLRGAVAVPVDIMSDTARARAIVEHSGAGLLIQSSFKTERLELPGLLIEELPLLLESYEPCGEPASPAPGDLAELIYTSGTTGTPKGVMLSHANLTANLDQVHRHLPVVDDRFRFLSLLPLSHMFEQMAGFLVPLSRGAAVCYLGTLKPSAITEALREERISAVIAVPRLLQLLRSGIEGELAEKGLSGVAAYLQRLAAALPRQLRRLLFLPMHRALGGRLELFVSGGAALPPELFRFWDGLGFRLLEGYGLTECSPVLTAATFGRQQAGSAGPPLPGIELRIAEGEVQARGANIFSGYYGNRTATAEAFTSDGWFRTGDIGERDENGWLTLKGRSREVIVTGAGINVFPDDIEAVLTRVAGVRDACVVGVDRGTGEEVHAVIIPDGSGRTPEQIMSEANRKLDTLQQITGATFWPEAEFPRTTTLKVRKFMVKERIASGSAPAGPAADRLTGLIAAVTGCRADEIREESVLAGQVGLTSIGRLELINLLEREYRLDLDEALIGAQTTVAELRAAIARRVRLRVNGHFRPWIAAPPLIGLRRLADALLHRPLLSLAARVEARGLERLEGIGGPVLFVSNHVSYLDQPCVMAALPAGLRYRTATAAWAEFFFGDHHPPLTRSWKRLAYDYCSWAFTVFPLSQVSGFRRSLAFMGQLVDRGFSVLIFPEGERTMNGGLLPFRSGLGVMAAELGIPLVPVRIDGLEKVLPRGASRPRRGVVRVSFGQPLDVRGCTPQEVVRLARTGIEELAGDG